MPVHGGATFGEAVGLRSGRGRDAVVGVAAACREVRREAVAVWATLAKAAAFSFDHAKGAFHVR